LLKLVYSDRIEALDDRIRESVKELPNPKVDGLRDSIEFEVAGFLENKLKTDVRKEFVIAHSYAIKSVRESSRNEEAEILVNEGPTPRYFSDESRLFASINEAYADNVIQIYAPISWPDSTKKDSLREAWRPDIRNIIVTQCLANRRTQS
jgi:hypothetical protein